MKRFLYFNFRFYTAWRRRMLRRFTPAGFLTIAVTFFSAVLGLNTYRALAYQIFTFLFAVLLISILSTFLFRKRFSARRDLPRFGTAGIPLTYTLRLRNLSRKSAKGVRILEKTGDILPDFDAFRNTPEPGEEKRNRFDRYMGFYRWQWLVSQAEMAKAGFRDTPDIPGGGEIALRAEILPRRRGVLRLEGLFAARPDPFGLINALRWVPVPQTVTILPRRYELPEIRLPGSRRYQSGGVALTTSVGDAEEFISLRDYRPGDPLRRIHWKSWAKTGKPIVREHQGEFFVRHALVLDTFQDEEFSESFEEAVSLAASFACTIRTQESLLDLLFVGTEAYCFTSGRGVGNLEKTLEVLASVRPCRKNSFETLASLAMSRGDGMSGAICILLRWDEERKRFVAGLRALGVPVLVMVVDEPGEGEKAETPGSMSDAPGRFFRLEAGKIAEGLAR